MVSRTISSNEDNDTKNTQLNMYFATKNFTQIINFSMALTIITLIILGAGLVVGYSGFEDRVNQNGTYITLYGSDCEKGGHESANEEFECMLFIPSPNFESNIEVMMSEIIEQHNRTVLWLGLGFAVVVGALIVIVAHYRPMTKPLNETLHQYIQEAYFLNIQLTSPKGTTRTERVLNLLSNVFPEVYLKSEDEQILEKKFGKYTFDVYVNTEEGKFAGRFFEGKLSLETLKEFTNNAKRYFESDDRVICIAKEFDPIFESDELKEKISKNIKGEFQLDILKEDDNGQLSIVWIG